MSVEQYRSLCHRYRGRAVQIRTRDGRVHRGLIMNVGNNRVYLRSFDGSRRNLGGFGYGYYGAGYGFTYGLALGAITSLVLLPFFFW
ncbi:hypothetical protein OEV98_02080 [Caldibacillus lycopersici]|uniref:Uncharacterized protein n=1 Tax=Perspicuibacillus lycopersici TaxID=1325689 RepID=A0AAE3IRY2_9BACI|nr:hypothetical protein [Perspicuibacillus lycopersici]MCU9612349.1 hypothetical protein [Perspicuibacillus lycopersici]